MSRWQALESSPEVLTALAESLSRGGGGESGSGGAGCSWRVVDVFGLEDELVEMSLVAGCDDDAVASCAAIIFLFPTSPEGGEKAEIRKVSEEDSASTAGMYYLRQDIGGLENACGTIAMCHALSNCTWFPLDASSVLGRFVSKSEPLNAVDRGMLLDKDDSIHDLHAAFVTRGQSAVVESGHVKHHFVSYVPHIPKSESDVDGGRKKMVVVELDGHYNSGPRVVAQVNASDNVDGQESTTTMGIKFAKAAASAIREEYVQKMDGNIQFSVLALMRITV